MGACDEMRIVEKSETTNDKTIEDKVCKLIEQACREDGNGGYTGTIAEAVGVKLRLNKTFDIKSPPNWDDEHDFIDEVAEKWGPAVVCRATRDGEDIGYAICGVYSS